MSKRPPRTRYKSVSGLCEFPECGRPHKAKGYCSEHYAHVRRGKPPAPIGPCRYRSERQFEQCIVSRCAETPEAHGYCQSHYYVKYKHGVSPELFQAVVDAQGGKCAICGKSEPRAGSRLAVDHCHATGEFRGALCTNCNQGLGKFFDNEDFLQAAINYLRKARIRKVA